MCTTFGWQILYVETASVLTRRNSNYSAEEQLFRTFSTAFPRETNWKLYAHGVVRRKTSTCRQHRRGGINAETVFGRSWGVQWVRERFGTRLTVVRSREQMEKCSPLGPRQTRKLKPNRASLTRIAPTVTGVRQSPDDRNGCATTARRPYFIVNRTRVTFFRNVGRSKAVSKTLELSRTVHATARVEQEGFPSAGSGTQGWTINHAFLPNVPPPQRSPAERHRRRCTQFRLYPMGT